MPQFPLDNKSLFFNSYLNFYKLIISAQWKQFSLFSWLSSTKKWKSLSLPMFASPWFVPARRSAAFRYSSVFAFTGSNSTNPIPTVPLHRVKIRNRAIYSGGIRRSGREDDRASFLFSRFRNCSDFLCIFQNLSNNFWEGMVFLRPFFSIPSRYLACLTWSP